MSVGLKGDYLRVSKPLTSDGVNLIVKDDKMQYKEVFLPLRSQKHIERKNERLGNNLKMKIEVVKNEPLPKKQKNETK